MNISAIHSPAEGLLLLGELLSPPKYSEQQWQLEQHIGLLSQLGAFELSALSAERPGSTILQSLSDALSDARQFIDGYLSPQFFSAPLSMPGGGGESLPRDLLEQGVFTLSDLWTGNLGKSDALQQLPLVISSTSESAGTLLQLGRGFEQSGAAQPSLLELRLPQLPLFNAPQLSRANEPLSEAKRPALPFEALRRPYELPSAPPGRSRRTARAFDTENPLQKLLRGLRRLFTRVPAPGTTRSN